jgi:hypothetical protein
VSRGQPLGPDPHLPLVSWWSPSHGAGPEGFETLTFCSESVPLVRAEELRVVLVALVNGVVQLPTLLTRYGPFRSFQVGKGWASDGRPLPALRIT